MRRLVPLTLSSVLVAAASLSLFAQTPATDPITIGGLPVVVLHSKAPAGDQHPHFVSLTLLPGRAMNFFQLTAYLPGLGEVPLMKSPSLEEAKAILDDPKKDPWGDFSYSFGGAFLLPWASRLSGRLAPDGASLTTEWHARPLTLRPNMSGRYAVHGLIHKAQATSLKIQKTAAGETITGIVHAGDFSGRWPSSTDAAFTIALTSSAVDITITAKNVGHTAEPMAIGWHPYFALPSHDRSQARVEIAAKTFAEVTPPDNLTTGVLTPMSGSRFDFNVPGGAALHDSVNVNLSGLDRNSHCTATLRDGKAGYSLCLRPLSPTIHTIQLYSPKDNTFVAIEPQFNLPDPLGSEWKKSESKEEDTGLVTLEPGASTVWHVRLELSGSHQTSK